MHLAVGVGFGVFAWFHHRFLRNEPWRRRAARVHWHEYKEGLVTDNLVTPINIPFPDTPNLHLRITAGAGHLTLRPGDIDEWVSGTFRDPSRRRQPRIMADGGTVRLSTFNEPLDEVAGILEGVPRAELTLGKGRPYKLTIEAGAGEFSFDLGGLPITELIMRQGAGEFDIDFSAPNPGVMRLCNLAGGAGEINMRHLANAACQETIVEGGVGEFKLDFGGTLRQPTTVRVTTGISAVRISVPATTAARITTRSVLFSTDVGDGFMKKEGAFWNEGALKGTSPVVDITVSGALGSVELKSY